MMLIKLTEFIKFREKMRNSTQNIRQTLIAENTNNHSEKYMAKPLHFERVAKNAIPESVISDTAMFSNEVAIYAKTIFNNRYERGGC
jgi:hypothetical protein